MRVTVEVTAADIAAGVREDCEACPVALAARRALVPLVPGVALVTADVASIDLFSAESIDRCFLLAACPTPPAVRDFIARFDDPRGSGDCVPFSFELEVPDRLCLLSPEVPS